MRNMSNLNAESLVKFVKALKGEVLNTRARGNAFTVEVDGTALLITPESGIERRIGESELERICAKYNRTKSLKPGDYTHDTQNSSYLLAIVGLFVGE